MRYLPLGNSGLLVSVIGLGCNNFGGRIDVRQARPVVDAAIDAGITFFDTAEMYGTNGGSELALGEILHGRRDKVVLATKFGHQAVDMGYGPAAPYFPLANGMLTGKVRRGQAPPAGTRIAARTALITDEKLDKVEALIGWGAERGVSLLEIAIGGLAAQPGCASVIAGATTAEQVAANAAAGNWVPTPEELEQSDKIVPPAAAPR